MELELNNISEEDVRLFCIEYAKNHKTLSNLPRLLINKNFYTYIDNWEKDKTQGYPFSHKLYWFITKKHDYDTCKVCGKVLGRQTFNNFNMLMKQTIRYCNAKCANLDNNFIEKRKQTLIEKYGVDNPSKVDTFKQKRRQTTKDRYGVEHYLNTDDFKEKCKNTMIERYGVPYYSKTKEYKQKCIDTCVSKYGVTNVSYLDDVKQKRIETCQKNLGCMYPSQNKDVLEKMKATTKDRYGVEFYTKTGEYKQNLEKHNIKMCGVKNINIYKSYQTMLSNEHDIPDFTVEEYAQRKNDYEMLKFKCKKCGNTFLTRHYDGFHKRCPNCYPKLTSHEEKELGDFVKSLCNNLIHENVRNIIYPYELDIYIPEKKLAIEFDGLYWHSDKSKNFHLTKTEMCEKQGIHLIHIFENEWVSKQNIVKARIKNLLGVYDNVVYARKCVVREIDYKTSCEFLDENHIQGKCVSGINIGLFYGDDLVSIMTFSKTRFSKKYEYELLRFCNKLGYHIPGSASKLLKYFERNYKPTSLVSYADRRWSSLLNGTVYDNLGLKLINFSEPNYWYFKTHTNNTLESRIKYQKHKLSNILPKFDESLTEYENMKNNGYLRIFDCGNFVYVKWY